ncbi:hypothetical protein [Deinococcus sp. YIM 77859]|uniref:hypothetical protein n=1 Tax=Deinococcus sp. YIM 77859 TaxID=1540221 RepID=UPI0012E030D8|nr:hypothetical protein [Deinococcus sp. YIM 77859]
MTRDEAQKQHNGGGDIQPEAQGTQLTDQQAKDMNALPGRGAHPVPGANPSDEYVHKHVEGMAEQGPDLLDPEHPTKKEREV